MNRKLFETSLLAGLIAAIIAVPAASFAAGQDVTKRVEEAVAALQHSTAAQKDEAAQKAKLTLDGVNEQIKQLEGRINDEWHDLNQFARQSAGATLNKLHDQRDDLAQRYRELTESSASQWESARNSFINSYNTVHQTLSDAEIEF